jgi:hypothetical protein
MQLRQLLAPIFDRGEVSPSDIAIAAIVMIMATGLRVQISIAIILPLSYKL